MVKDAAKAREWLDKYLANLDEYERQPADGWGKAGPKAEELLAWFQLNQDRVKVVAEDLVPDEVWTLAGYGTGWAFEEQNHIRRALGTLENAEALSEFWSSDLVIEIDPDALHPWVWNAARDLWASEHWGEAVEAATKVLNVKLQEKVGRPDQSGTDLVRRSFSLSPPHADQPRVRVMDDDGSETYKSAQEGAMHLGEAVFMYWRNVLAHEPGGAERQPAIEALASVSALARMVDKSKLERG